MSNIIFDFNSSRLKLELLENISDALSDLEIQLIASEAPYEAAYVAEIERKPFNHAACQCGDWDYADTLDLRRLHMGPSFLLHRVILLVNCQSELLRSEGDH